MATVRRAGSQGAGKAAGQAPGAVRKIASKTTMKATSKAPTKAPTKATPAAQAPRTKPAAKTASAPPPAAGKSAPKAAPKSAPRKKSPTRRAPRALSLHLGLNLVDPRHYAGWSGPLAACEADAQDLTALARGQGMTPTTLLTAQATRAAFLAALREAAAALGEGDLFLLSFSGHGGQVPDTNRDEADRMDETWCLHDGQLLDDELYFELSRFGRGVRVVVLSDSCHSGTVTRAGREPSAGAGAAGTPRLMPAVVASRVYAAHRGEYDALQREVFAAAAPGRRAARDDPDAALAQVAFSGPAASALQLTGPFRPAVLLISGCQDNQVAMDGPRNGAFTEQLLKAWDRGRFDGSYTRLHATVRAAMPASQTPNLSVLGPPYAAAALAAERAFRV